MKFNINKISFIAAIVVIISAFLACNNDKKTDEKSAEINATGKAEEAHEEVTSTIATLTSEQIKTVGIALGTVEFKELTATIKANGNLSVPNNNKANATSLYGGVIKTLNVQIGNYVKKGQVIATITNPQFIQLQEEYLTAASKILFAEQEVSRQKELNEGSAGAKKNLQSATAELNSLRTRRSSLQQQIQLMGINPGTLSNGNLKSSLVVTSPSNGTISNVFAKIGSYIDVSSPVVEIVDNSSLHLDLQVFEKDLPQVNVGQTIHFTLTNNPTTEYDATVFSIGSSFENDSKTIAVHCRVNGNKTGLIDGMNITGIVSLSNVTTPAVPNSAIVNADGKYYVFVQTDKKAEEHHEEAGEAQDHKEDEKHDHKEGEAHEHKEADKTDAKNLNEKKEHKDEKSNVSFEKIEVLKGVSNMGYTAITFITAVPKNAKIVVKGAFFVNAKLSNTGGHEH